MERGRSRVTGRARGTGPDMAEEPIEDLGGVEGAGRALGVVLHRLDGQVVMPQALDRAVVEVALADEEARGGGQRVGHDLDLVVLGGHRHPPAALVADGMVGGVVAEAQAPRAGRPPRGPRSGGPRQMPSSGRPSSMTARARPPDPRGCPGRQARAR